MRPRGAWTTLIHRHRFCRNADAQVSYDDRVYGFQRPSMYSNDLRGSVLPYHRHVFLCFAEHGNWPPQVETSHSPSYDLPRSITESLRRHSHAMPKKTRFNLCQGCNPTETSKASVLIFPEMVKYREITTNEVDHFVKEVLVDGQEWSHRKPEMLKGSHVFVCSHGSRDRRCGVCGPALIQQLNKEISDRELNDHVFVRSCSHVGGHKYAGNIIIYGKDDSGTIGGHWYGYVTPGDVSSLLDQHVLKGQIVDKLWRGQMN